MKKLLVFHPALAPYRVDFFNGLAENFDVQFYFSRNNVADQNFDQQQLRAQCNFEFRLLDKGWEIGKRSLRTGIFKLLRTQKPVIVICSEYSQVTLFVLLFKLLFNSKLKVYTISDDSIDLSVKRAGLRKFLRDKTSNILDGVILPSQQVGEWYTKHVNAKTQVLELPIVHDNETFRIKLSKTLSISESYVMKYNLEGKNVFLFVGRLVEIKNVDFLIRSFSKSKQPNDKLCIIGNGVEYSNLDKLVQTLELEDDCILTGRLEGDELIAWYNIAKCFILPSYQEPYGAVVNEALIAGCKVLCSEKAGAASLINYTNGKLFDPYNSLQLQDEISKMSSSIVPLSLPLYVKSDLMPFKFKDKLDVLFKLL